MLSQFVNYCAVTTITIFKMTVWLEDMGYTVVAIYIILVIGAVTSVLTSRYIFYKLRLNKLIKGILTVMSIQTGISFIVMFISLIIINYDERACYPFAAGWTIGFWSSAPLTSMISILKYYMTMKAFSAK